MFDEPELLLNCCITAKFGRPKNSLLKYFDVHVGHFERNISYKYGWSVDYQNDCFRDSLSIQSEMIWFPSKTDQVPLPFGFYVCLDV